MPKKKKVSNLLYFYLLEQKDLLSFTYSVSQAIYINMYRQLTNRKIRILNIDIDNITSHKLLTKINKGGVLLTPNVDHLVKLQFDSEFYQIYQQAEYVVCDSQILIYVSKFLGNKIVEKISGSDFFPQFYQHYKNDRDIRIFLLGGERHAVKLAQSTINTKVGRQIVVGGYSPPFGFEHDRFECERIIQLINNSGATVLAVGLGAPKQEKWIARYKSQLPKIKIFLAIGATINFEAGIIKRAPKWMSEVGLEWLHRLVLEPRRLWKRYLLEAPLLLWLVLKQKFNCYRHEKL